jgi:hypothetical protein
MLSVGAAVAAYWVGLWLLDLPVDPVRTLVSLLVAVLVFDRLTIGEGTMAGLTVGFFASIGLLDIMEARRWKEVERARAVRLYTLVRPHAMLASYGQMEIFEVPRNESDPDEEPVGATGFEI